MAPRRKDNLDVWLVTILIIIVSLIVLWESGFFKQPW